MVAKFQSVWVKSKNTLKIQSKCTNILLINKKTWCEQYIECIIISIYFQIREINFTYENLTIGTHLPINYFNYYN